MPLFQGMEKVGMLRVKLVLNLSLHKIDSHAFHEAYLCGVSRISGLLSSSSRLQNVQAGKKTLLLAFEDSDSDHPAITVLSVRRAVQK